MGSQTSADRYAEAMAPAEAEMLSTRLARKPGPKDRYAKTFDVLIGGSMISTRCLTIALGERCIAYGYCTIF